VKNTRLTARSRMRGLSLVEIMVSLVIGLVVVGAVIVSYLSSGQANKLQSAYAEMNENAQIAMSTMQQDLLLAGYTQPVGINGLNTGFIKTFMTRSIFGCDNGFAAPNTIGVAACAVGAGTPAIEMSYEADVSNSVPTSGFPSDCMGNSLRYVVQTIPVGVNNITFYETHNRYYLAIGSTGRSELHCASAAKTVAGVAINGQPLVDNVENIKVWYGEANAVNPRQIVRYVTASLVTDWQNIVSVRICLLMRSAETVLNTEDTSAGTASYLDCDSVSQTSADRYLRRTYFMTTTLRNKMTL
jgi:type IV pilus assembly protein PilW